MTSARPAPVHLVQGRFPAFPGLLLLLAFAAYLLIAGAAATLPRLCIAGAVVVLIVAGTVRVLRSGDLLLLQRAALAAGLFAAIVPLGLAAMEEPLLRIVSRAPLWPQILVLLVAARLQSEIAERRFRLFWRDPLRAEGGARTQSIGGAVCLGLAASLFLYAALGSFFPGDPAAGPPSPAGVLLRSLLGDTFVHQAIVLLFFVLLAVLLDSWLLLRFDRTAFRAIREALGPAAPPLSRAEIAAIASQVPGDLFESRTLAYIRESCGLAGAAEERRTLEGLHGATRRLLRALLAFLPLLGFVGTVIGLAVAIGNLGSANGREGADIGSSLAGLSIQFETTLLGLATGLVASLALATLERQESELRHACERLVEVLATRDGR